jgi:hypothetical protein
MATLRRDRKLQAAMAALLIGCAFTGAGAADKAELIMVKPDDLKWAEVNSLPPGAKAVVIEGQMDKAGPITARLQLPANYVIPPHWHPQVERVTVLSGTFNYGMGDKVDKQKSTALPAGSVVVMQPKMHHYAWTTEPTVVQLNTAGPWDIVYINPADDPRKKK